MVHYAPIRFWKDDTAKARAIDKLLKLRSQLHSDVTKKRSTGAFLLATWNLRDFDSNKFGHGKRLDESYYYMAEIISTFDLVALQEVNRDLRGLKKLMKLLGRNWDFIATDTTEGRGGNQERMAFVFDTNKIRFANVAGEVVLPSADRQFARTPFVAAFQAGWFKFNLCTVHIYFGADRGEKLERRVQEISDVAEFFKKRQEREKGDYILLGDFNIVDDKHPTMNALTRHGYTLPEELIGEETNLKGDKQYDQIALRVKNKMLEVDNAGVFDFEQSVFTDSDDDFSSYRHAFPDKQVDGKTEDELRKYYLSKWRTFQISDHKPMWVELKVDFTRDYLNSLRPEKDPLADLDEPE